MIRHTTEKKRENVALNKEQQQNIENVDQMGECPIIFYKYIQESNGLNDNQEFKGAPKIYQNQTLYIDPDNLIDF